MRIIMKGIEQVYSEQELLKKLEKGVPLNVKYGLDPSAPDIHLGHTVPLRKLRQMQELGHNIIVIIGDFTGRIGNPTGKSKGRKALSDEEVRRNAETYCEQVFKVLDKEKTILRFNSEWLSRLRLDQVIELARMLSQGGVRLDGEKLSEISARLVRSNVLKIGKKTFLRLV